MESFHAPILLDEEQNKTKIIDVILRSNNDLRITAVQERFSGLSEIESTEIIILLLQSASEQCSEKSKILLQEDNDPFINTPINSGSLYDDIFFDCGIYLNDKREVIINTNFGALSDPNVCFSKSLEKVSEAMNFLINHLQEKIEELNVEQPTITPKLGNEKANRF